MLKRRVYVFDAERRFRLRTDVGALGGGRAEPMAGKGTESPQTAADREDK